MKIVKIMTLDDCPDTASGVLVDLSGCAALDGVIDGLDFALGDHRLNQDSRVVLAELVDELELYPTAVVAISAHTDNRGSARAQNRRIEISVVSYE